MTRTMRMTLTMMMLKMTIVNVGLAPIPAHIYILKPWRGGYCTRHMPPGAYIARPRRAYIAECAYAYIAMPAYTRFLGAYTAVFIGTQGTSAHPCLI